MKHFSKLIWGLVLAIVQIQTMVAQTTPPVFNDDTVDSPGAPINEWIIPVLLLAIGFGYYLCNKIQKKDIKTNN